MTAERKAWLAMVLTFALADGIAMHQHMWSLLVFFVFVQVILMFRAGRSK